MVTEFGFSDKLGPLHYDDNERDGLAGYVPNRQTISEDTAKLIDAETRRLVEEGEAKARKILAGHVDQLGLLAKALLEHETLTGDEVTAVLRGEPVRTATEAGTSASAIPAQQTPVPADVSLAPQI
jgi:cell division protease FtsH